MKPRKTERRALIPILGAAIVFSFWATGHAQEASECDSKFMAPEGGIRAYWTFNDQNDPITDVYAGQTGTNLGATWTASGVVEGALHFDGVNDYINYGHNELTNFSSWDEWTLSVWFLNDGGGDLRNGYGQKIMAKNTTQNDMWLAVNTQSLGQVAFVTCYESGQVGNCSWMVDDTHNYGDGIWHHVVVVKDGLYAELWVDGELKDFHDEIQTPNNTMPLYVGYSPHPDSFQKRLWSGDLDEIAVFDRALTPDEVTELYENSAAGRHYCSGMTVALDIKPRSCPNPFNIDQHGVSPAAILGTVDLDVNDIDPSSILLVLPQGTVAPIRTNVEDVAAPVVDPSSCECTRDGPDGFYDLTLKFDAVDVAEALGEVEPGDVIEICTTGQLADGTPFNGCDCIFIPGPVPVETWSWGRIKALYQ